MSGSRPCRCLLRETGEQEIYESVKAYVDALPEQMRASEEVYQSRLRLCRQCEQLLSGMCVKCGCFVEARAAKAAQRCPFVPPRW